MRQALAPWLVLVGLGIYSPFAWAQDTSEDLITRSHGRIPSTDQPLSQVLTQRLLRAKDNSDLQELLRQIITEEFKKDPQKFLKDNQEKINKLRESARNGKLKLDNNDPLIERIKKNLQSPEYNGLRNVPEFNKLSEALRQPDSSSNPAGIGSDSAAAPSGNGGPSAGDQPPPATPAAAADSVQEFKEPSGGDRLAQMFLQRFASFASRNGIFRNNSAFRDAIDEVNRFRLKPGADQEEPYGNRFSSALSDLVPQRVRSQINWDKLSNFSFAGLSGVQLPDLSMPTEPSSQDPSFEFNGPSSSAVGIGLIFLVSIGILVMIGWQIIIRFGSVGGFRMVGKRGGGRFREDWALGPWPIAPDKVATRAEFVQAFEYLSLLRLGPDARSWNHWDIAGKLTAEQIDKGQVVGRLASLYELARYTPSTESFPENAIPAAGRELNLLAGAMAE